jgi:zeta-carotene isomerase
VLTVLFYTAYTLRAQTTNSVLPFQAIIEGRQQLPEQYWKEFARGPYAIILAGTVGAYFAHPFMQAGSYLLHW